MSFSATVVAATTADATVSDSDTSSSVWVPSQLDPPPLKQTKVRRVVVVKKKKTLVPHSLPLTTAYSSSASSSSSSTITAISTVGKKRLIVKKKPSSFSTTSHSSAALTTLATEAKRNPYVKANPYFALDKRKIKLMPLSSDLKSMQHKRLESIRQGKPDVRLAKSSFLMLHAALCATERSNHSLSCAIREHDRME
jgi:hypothetical protein